MRGFGLVAPLVLQWLLLLAPANRPPIVQDGSLLEVGSRQTADSTPTTDMDTQKEKDLTAAATKVKERWAPKLGLSEPRLMAKVGAGIFVLLIVIVLAEVVLAKAKHTCFRGCPVAPATCCLASFVAGTIFYNNQRRVWQLAMGLGEMVSTDISDEIVLGSVLLAASLSLLLTVNLASFFVSFTAQSDTRRFLFGAKSDQGVSCCTRFMQCLMGNALTQFLMGLLWLTFLASLAASYVAAVASFLFSTLQCGCESQEKTAQLQQVLGEVADLAAVSEQLRGIEVTKLCPLLDQDFQPVHFVVSGALLVVTQTAMVSLASRDRARIKEEIQHSREGGSAQSYSWD